MSRKERAALDSGILHIAYNPNVDGILQWFQMVGAKRMEIRILVV